MSINEIGLKRVAILGGSGFTGAELYRLLSKHPIFNVDFISSESKAGYLVEKVFRPFFHKKKINQLKFQRIDELEGEFDIIFSCLPTGLLPQKIEKISNHTSYIFNLSGDYRITDTNVLQKYYPETLKQKFVEKAHYFIPEFSEVNYDTKIVNLPGCMAVASIYSLYPLLVNDLIDQRIIIDVKTGSSGGGKSSTEHHAERSQNFRPHKIHGHRHKPEIEQIFNENFNTSIDLQFSAYSLDLPRGIMVNTYSKLKNGVSEIDVKKAFHNIYSTKIFVSYLKSSNASQLYPMIKSVVGTNHVEVGVYIDGENCVSIATIDNLIKGAAGQAIQAANIYMGIDENMGLDYAEGVWP